MIDLFIRKKWMVWFGILTMPLAEATTLVKLPELVSKGSNLTDEEFKQKACQQKKKLNVKKKKKVPFLSRSSSNLRESVLLQVALLKRECLHEKEPLGEKKYKKAFLLWNKLIKCNKPDRVSIYTILHLLVRLDASSDEAYLWAKEALKWAKKMAGGEDEPHHLLVEAHMELAQVSAALGRYKEAEAHVKKAAFLQLKLPVKKNVKRLVAMYLFFGWLENKRSFVFEASKVLKKANTLLLQYYGTQNGNLVDHVDWVILYRSLAHLYFSLEEMCEQKKYKERVASLLPKNNSSFKEAALEAMDKSLEMMKRLIHHGSTNYLELGWCWYGMGKLRHRYYGTKEAIPCFEQALQASKLVDTRKQKEQTFKCLRELSSLYVDLGRYKEALTLCKQAQELAERFYKNKNHIKKLETLFNVGVIEFKLKNIEKAYDNLMKGCKMIEAMDTYKYGKNSLPFILETSRVLLLFAEEDVKKAKRYYLKVIKLLAGKIELVRILFPSNEESNLYNLPIYNNMGCAYLGLKQWREAVYYLEALQQLCYTMKAKVSLQLRVLKKLEIAYKPLKEKEKWKKCRKEIKELEEQIKKSN